MLTCMRVGLTLLTLLAIAGATPKAFAQHSAQGSPPRPMDHPGFDIDFGVCPQPDSLGDLESAEARCHQLLAATERADGPSSLKTARVLYALSLEIDYKAGFSEAEPLLRRALAIALTAASTSASKTPEEAFKAAEAADLFSIGNALIENLEKQGRPLEAGVVADTLRKRDTPDGRAGISTGPYNSITWMPGVAGAYPQPAIRAPTEAEKAQVLTWSDRANTDDREGRYSDGESLYRDILRLDLMTFGARHPETASARRDLGFNLYLQHRGAEAEEVLTGAFPGDNQTNGAPLRQAMVAALEQVKSREASGQPANVNGAYEAARYIFEHPVDFTDDLELERYSDLAASLDRLGNASAAEQIYRQVAQAYGQRGGYLTADVIKYKYLLARSLEEQGKHAQAVAAFRDACGKSAERSSEAGRGELANLGPSLVVSQSADCSLGMALAMRMWAEAGGGPAPDDRTTALKTEAFEAAQASLQSSAGNALARSGAVVAARSAGAGGAAEGFEVKLAERDAVNKEIAQAAGRALPPGLTQRNSELGLEIATAAAALADKYPFYWDLRSPAPLTAAQLQAARGPDAVLLHHNEAVVLWVTASGADRGLVFALSKAGFAWAQMGMTGNELAAEVKALRKTLDPLGSVSGQDLASAGQGMGAGQGSGSGGMSQGPAPPAASTVSAPASAGFDRAGAFRLYQTLLGDAAIQKVIHGPGIDTLLIVPSGALTSLPPAVLVTAPPMGPDNDPAPLRATHWLIRETAIAILPQVSALKTLRQLLPQARLGQAHGPALPLLAFADPDFAGTGQVPGVFPGRDPYVVDTAPAASVAGHRGAPPATAAESGGRSREAVISQLPPLWDTRREGVALMTLLKAERSDLLLGPAASKTELMARQADLARATVVDFSTHGLITGDFTGLTEPALVFAAPPKGADPAKDDQLLRASEAAALTLTADWVVLSACNTASGEAPGAEGLSGLARAFFHAGAKSLLVSHWRVDDAATERLITHTFTRYRTGAASKAKALQAAMTAMIDTPSLANPTFWAPFVIVGEPN